MAHKESKATPVNTVTIGAEGSQNTEDVGQTWGVRLWMALNVNGRILN